MADERWICDDVKEESGSGEEREDLRCCAMEDMRRGGGGEWRGR